ncbi:MAG: class I SAM-dependent methyltransferase [Methylophaga sp.]|nr:class I SAM-dependent methyltransferase [Methylophaga sp.]
MTKKRKVLAFGVEPNHAKYRLRVARYPALAKAICRFVHHSPQKNKLSLLDIGVGYGRTFRYVSAEKVEDKIDWHGIDIRRIPQDKLAGADAYNIKLANIADGLPYKDDSFDIIVAEQILEHLKDPAFAVSEISRVARPGALVIIGVPIFVSWFTSLRNLYIKYFPGIFKWSGSDHHQTFSLDTIRQLLLEHGDFVEKEVRGFRILSGGILRPLENYHWWYKFQGNLGKKFPRITVEVQFCLQQPGYNT